MGRGRRRRKRMVPGLGVMTSWRRRRSGEAGGWETRGRERMVQPGVGKLRWLKPGTWLVTMTTWSPEGTVYMYLGRGRGKRMVPGLKVMTSWRRRSGKAGG